LLLAFIGASSNFSPFVVIAASCVLDFLLSFVVEVFLVFAFALFFKTPSFLIGYLDDLSEKLAAFNLLAAEKRKALWPIWIIWIFY